MVIFTNVTYISSSELVFILSIYFNIDIFIENIFFYFYAKDDLLQGLISRSANKR